ncbi:MAG: GNAT family N-acetyltransferase [Streptosporangiales bacterium]
MITIRPIRPEELGQVGDLTARVYVDAGFLTPESPYLTQLRDAARRARAAELLVAVDGTGAVVGSVTYVVHGGDYAELAGPGEGEFRMLVVAPEARKQGIGEALVRACLDRARAAGCTAMRLSTQAEMTDAHRLYERVGFARTPDLDWSPAPGVSLLAYALSL